MGLINHVLLSLNTYHNELYWQIVNLPLRSKTIESICHLKEETLTRSVNFKR